MGKRLIWVLLIVFTACSAKSTIIRSEPPTAFVTINGVPKGVTPLELKLDCEKNETFEIQVSAPGFLTQTKNLNCRKILGVKKGIFFELKPGEQTTPPDVPPDLPDKQQWGTLKIKSVPHEAEVYLDGTFIGTTPFIEPNIKIGDYLLEVRKPGFKPWRRDIHVTAGTIQEYCPVLEEE